MFFLDVPYAEKDQARQLGARWDAGSKKWYVPKGDLATPFERWMPAGDASAKMLSRAALEAKRPATRAAKDRKLSMSDSAIRSRAKKAAAKDTKPSDRATRRADDVTGKITIGANYKPAIGAVGLPWTV